MDDKEKSTNVLTILWKKLPVLVITGIIVSCLFMGFKYFNKTTYTLAPSDDILGCVKSFV